MDDGGGNGARLRKIPVHLCNQNTENIPDPFSKPNVPHASIPSATVRSSAVALLPFASCTPPCAFAISSRHET